MGYGAGMMACRQLLFGLLGKTSGSEIRVISDFFGTGQRRGQQCPCRSHGSKQLLWKVWLQGSVATTSASAKEQRQMQHMSSELPSRILQQPLRSNGDGAGFGCQRCH